MHRIWTKIFGSKKENVEEEVGRHTYVSFSYTKEKGAYVTMYYAPKLEGER